MNNTKPTDAMHKRDRSTSPPSTRSTPSPPPADQPTIPSILPADFYACYNQNDGHLTDIYGYFTPGPKTWRMAPHHFDPIPADLDTEAYAALLQRNQDESQINKHALHIWIVYGIDTLYTDPKERHAIQLQCYEILRSQQAGTPAITSDLHLVFDLSGKYGGGANRFTMVPTQPPNKPVHTVHEIYLQSHLRHAATRLVDLHVLPNDRKIVAVLSREYHRNPTNPKLLTNLPTKPLFHLDLNGKPSKDWPSDRPPVAPRDISRCLGDNSLCIALAGASQYLTTDQERNMDDITSQLTLLHDQIVLHRHHKPPARSIAPRDIPVFSDYSLVVTYQRTWRIDPGHFDDYMNASQHASNQEEIRQNIKTLMRWVNEGYRKKWVDPVARYVMRSECFRILATQSNHDDTEKPAATNSNIHLSWKMIQPIRIPRLK